ncbi:MAG: ribonuclease P protein component [Clostridiales bacterium]|nr:ribonuclease P protein component [Clostridiales bacterium]
MKLRAIRENHLYSKAYSKGKKYVGRCVVVYTLPDYAAARIAKADPSGQRCNRVGITVTKKLGNAVIRNRAKRIIREGYRMAQKSLSACGENIRKGNLIVIVARASILNAKSQDIEKDMTAAFRRLLTKQNQK